MVWDLRGALLKKGEHESARLADFEYRHRARTFRLLGEELGLDPDTTVALIAKMNDEKALAALAAQAPERAVELRSLYDLCTATARRELISERGDPTPHRLL